MRCSDTLPIRVGHCDACRRRREPVHHVVKRPLPGRAIQPRQPYLHRRRRNAGGATRFLCDRREPAMDGSRAGHFIPQLSGRHGPRHPLSHRSSHAGHGCCRCGTKRSSRGVFHVDDRCPPCQGGLRLRGIANAHQEPAPDHWLAPAGVARFAATRRLLSSFTSAGDRGSHQRPSSTR